MVDNNQERMFTVKEIASILNVHHETVRKWCYEGKLSRVRLGSGPKAPIRIRESDLRKFFASDPRNITVLPPEGDTDE
jgi:excisionase family DNA binding protein